MSFLESVTATSSFLSALNQNMPAFVGNVGNLVSVIKEVQEKPTGAAGVLSERLSTSLANEQGRVTGAGLASTLGGISGSKSKQSNGAQSGLGAIENIFTSLSKGTTLKSAVALQGGIKGMVAGSAQMMLITGAMSILGNIVAPFSSILTTLGSLGTILGTGFQPMINDINKAIITLMPYMFAAAAWMGDTYNGIKEWISNLSWEKIKASIGDWATGIKDKLSEGWNTAVTWLGSVGNSIKDGIVSAWNTAINWLVEKKDMIKDKIKDAWDIAVTWLTGVGTTIKDTIKTSWDTVTTWFSNIGTGIKDTLVTAWKTVTDWFSSVFTGIKTSLETGWKAVTDWFAAIPGTILTAITTSGTDVVGAIRNWWASLWD